MASQAIISRLAGSDEENIYCQGVVDSQGRLHRAKGWPQKRISVCMFDCPEIATWNGENPFSFLIRLQ